MCCVFDARVGLAANFPQGAAAIRIPTQEAAVSAGKLIFSYFERLD